MDESDAIAVPLQSEVWLVQNEDDMIFAKQSLFKYKKFQVTEEKLQMNHFPPC